MIDLEFTPEWHKKAACRGVGNKVFFPTQGETPIKAQEYCKTCPVTEECFMTAVLHDDDFGVWGGLTKQHRNKEIKLRIINGTLKKELVGSLNVARNN